MIAGFVGRLTPGDPSFAAGVTRFTRNSLFRGIRVSGGDVAGLTELAKLRDPEIRAAHDLSLDVNGSVPSLPAVAAVARAVPGLRIVIDHVANVAIDGRAPPADWLGGMDAVCRGRATYSGKGSGLALGADVCGGKAPADVEFYRPVLDAVWERFGEERVIYGSNWPVSEVFAPFGTAQWDCCRLLQDARRTRVATLLRRQRTRGLQMDETAGIVLNSDIKLLKALVIQSGFGRLAVELTAEKADSRKIHYDYSAISSRYCMHLLAVGAATASRKQPTPPDTAEPAAALTFRAEQIATDFGIGYAVTTGDVNGDGRTDVVAINATDLVWFEAPSWQKRVMLSGVTARDNVTLALNDIDRDGRLDVALGAGWQPTNTTSGGTLQWVGRAGAGADAPWEMHPISEEPTLHRIRWDDADGDGVRYPSLRHCTDEEPRARIGRVRAHGS